MCPMSRVRTKVSPTVLSWNKAASTCPHVACQTLRSESATDTHCVEGPETCYYLQHHPQTLRNKQHTLAKALKQECSTCVPRNSGARCLLLVPASPGFILFQTFETLGTTLQSLHQIPPSLSIPGSSPPSPDNSKYSSKPSLMPPLSGSPLAFSLVSLYC